MQAFAKYIGADGTIGRVAFERVLGGLIGDRSQMTAAESAQVCAGGCGSAGGEGGRGGGQRSRQRANGWIPRVLLQLSGIGI